MPDKSRPSPTPKASTVEFDFVQVSKKPVPRIKSRSLKAKPRTAAKTASPVEEPAPSITPAPQPAPSPAAIKPVKPVPTAAAQLPESSLSSPRPAYRSTVHQSNPPTPHLQPSSSTSAPRRTTLYYTSDVETPAQEAGTPMKSSSSPSAASTPVTAPKASTPFRSAASPAAASTGPSKLNTTVPPAASSKPEPTVSSAGASKAATPVATTVSSPARNTPVTDYRANIERQSREQKSVGGVLAVLVYVLIGCVVLGGLLAGYGTYALSKQIRQQSLTVSDLDSRYTAQNQALIAQMKDMHDTLGKALIADQAQLGTEQQVIAQQQDAINKLTAANQTYEYSLRQERQTRASENAALRSRVHSMESQLHLAQ